MTTIQVSLILFLYRVPLYTFGEDFVLNSSVYLMTVGDKNFASEYSVIGDFGYVQRRLGYKQLMENLGIEHKFIHSGEKKVKLSPYDDLKEEDVKWMEGQLKHRESRLKAEIMQNRNQKVDQEMWNKTLLTGQQALKYGLVDGLGVFDDIREKEYKGIKSYDILSNLLDYYVPANATFSSYSFCKGDFQYDNQIEQNFKLKNQNNFISYLLHLIFLKQMISNLFYVQCILIHLIECFIHINYLIKVSYFQIHYNNLIASVDLF